MNWDDLRYFLAIAETGSLTGAAERLAVNHSTVYRRIGQFEADLDVRLFERHADGYQLTAAGEEMRASAKRVDAEFNALDRRVPSRQVALNGAVVVTTTDTLAATFLGPHFAAFQRTYPGISLEVVLDPQRQSLSKRQADVAIRETRAPPEALFGQRIADIAFAVYGSRDPDGRLDFRDDFDTAPWLVYDDSLADLPAAKWLRDTVAGKSIALRANNLLALLGAAKASMGITVLPCFMGDAEPTLARWTPALPDFASELWLLAHKDLRRTACVGAFLDYMSEAMTGDRDLLEGFRPTFDMPEYDDGPPTHPI